MTSEFDFDYVFDAEPLIAIPYDELGADRAHALATEVYERTATGAMSAITATELVYKIGWIEADATLIVGADSDFDDLPIDVDIERIRSPPA